MASVSDTPGAGRRGSPASHEGFLRHRRYRWLKISSILSFACLVAYLAADVEPHPNGGSWLGYTLGSIGAGLIVWLSLLGVRKRAITPGNWSLRAWTSAHVYLGLSLIVIATLHTGFQLGWNIHTLAYALMMLVILSGAFGIYVYATLPSVLSSNREEMTQAQMIESLSVLDRQLADAAQPLPRTQADLVREALAQDPFEGGALRRLSGNYPACATQAAIEALAASSLGDAALDRVEKLLIRRMAQLERLRRQMRIKAMLEVWLYVHVPATIALLAALLAHIVSVFFYW